MFSEEETSKLDELRNRVLKELINDEQKEDYFLIRWLRARNMDVNKAEEMLRKSLQWRKDTGADTILETEDFPEKYKKKFMFAILGEDNEGCPIVLLPAGRHNHRMLLEKEGMEACMRWNIVWMEKIMKLIRDSKEKSGKPAYHIHELLDMEGYSYKSFAYKPAVDYIIETQKMFDDHYPEVLKSAVVINAPRIFTLLFAILKPMIPKATLDKLSIFGCDEDAWKKALAERFPMDKFPPRWGGNMQGTDEFCSQDPIWFDGPVPLGNFKEVLEEDEEGFLKVKINARDKLKLDFNIECAGTTIQWKFKTENHDIAFQLCFLEESSMDKDVIIPLERVDSQKEVQEGSKTFESKGTCVVVFDNRFSITKSKTLKYQIKLIKDK